MASLTSVADFQKIIRAYYRAHGRDDLPWRRTRDPYRVLVSEIMLQQTQVARVIPFYEKFIKKFPGFRELARAKTPEVLRLWQGLGYNRRALALKKLAQEVVEKYGGRLPRDREALLALPGIGPYTAGAIRTFAFDEPEVFIETNIRRVFVHFFFPHARKVTDVALSRYIERALDGRRPRDWYFALMDYGAMLGTAVHVENPNRRSAHYARQKRFTGSDRELRGRIVRELLSKRKLFLTRLSSTLKEPADRVRKIVVSLRDEGFLLQKGDRITPVV